MSWLLLFILISPLHLLSLSSEVMMLEVTDPFNVSMVQVKNFARSPIALEMAARPPAAPPMASPARAISPLKKVNGPAAVPAAELSTNALPIAMPAAAGLPHPQPLIPGWVRYDPCGRAPELARSLF